MPKVFSSAFMSQGQFYSTVSSLAIATVTSLNQYRQYKSLQTSDSGNKYLGKLVCHQIETVDMDLMRLYREFEEVELEDLTTLISILFDILKQNDSRKFHDADNQILQKVQPNIKINNYCPRCKIAVERSKIKEVKQNYGITEALDHEKQQQFEQMKLKQKQIRALLDDDDGFMENFKLNMANLNYYMKELQKFMEKQMFSKTFMFLGKDNQINDKKQVRFEQQKSICTQNQKQFKEIQKYRQKFTDNFISQIKIPLQDSVIKIVASLQQKRKKHLQQMYVEASVQTTYSTDSQKIVYLEQKVVDLKAEIMQLKSTRTDLQRQISQYISGEAKLKTDLINFNQQKMILEDRLKREQMNLSLIQSKHKYQIKMKQEQLGKLDKVLAEYRKKNHQNYQNMYNIISKQSHKSINDKKGTSTRIIDKESIKNNVRHRPSVDYNLLEQMESSQRNSKDEHGLAKAKKYMNYVKLTKNNSENYGKQGVAASRFSKAQINDQIMEEQVQERKPFSIIDQVNIIINQKMKIDQSEVSVQIDQKLSNNLSKKIKSLRSLKSHKKQVNFSKIEKITQINNYSMTLPFDPKQNENTVEREVESDKSKQQLRHTAISSIRQKSQRLKTEAFEPAEKMITAVGIGNSRSIEKLKSGAVLVRQLKSRGVDQNWKDRCDRAEKLDSGIVLPDIVYKNLVLFGGQKSALQYQKNIGIWPHLFMVEKLAVDLQNSGFATQIQSYFKILEESIPQKYKQYTQFLQNPISFLEGYKNKKQNKIVNQSRIERQIDLLKIDGSTDSNRTNVRDIFVKLIRYHKIIHRSCGHVNQFLEMIGFYGQ